MARVQSTDTRRENIDRSFDLGIALSYALPALILAPLSVSFYVFVPKLFSDLGTITLETIGIIILVTRIWDAVTDPLIGYLSDRLEILQGKRKIWLWTSVIPLCATFGLLFTVVDIPPHFHLAWFTVGSLLFFLFWTMYAIPYEALGQRIVVAYHDKTKIFAIRDGAFLIGTLLAALLPLFVARAFSHSSPWTHWSVIAFTYSVALMGATIVCNRNVNESSTFPKSSRPFSPWNSFRLAYSNEYFRTLLIAYVIASFGAALPASLFLFYVQYVLQSTRSLEFLALYFVVGIAALPIWVMLARRLGKKRVWLGALFINAFGFLGVYFLNPGEEIQYAMLITFSALGYGGTLALPSSIQADILDAEELRSGERSDGEFLGIWSFAKKLSAALGVGAGLVILGMSGFDPKTAIQSSSTLMALRILYCVVPCACAFISLYVMQKFTLDELVHAQILSDLDKRNLVTT